MARIFANIPELYFARDYPAMEPKAQHLELDDGLLPMLVMYSLLVK